jgi:molybdenum cofactor biosynthesis enzyme MoaA
MVSSNAARWQEKRDLYRYDPRNAPLECTLKCDDCNQGHRPKLVFVDVTNRCNLNCPICLANVPAMGFVFDPPLSYFARIFDELERWDPKPRVELFGGEPTVREDIFEIIRMARDRGLAVSLVTNSVSLADEDYCKRVCSAKVDLLLAFDGRDPVIYETMRGSRSCYEKKLQALDNVRKHSRRKHTIVCTVAHNLNDRHMKDYFEFIHGYLSITRRLFFIPLAEMWEGDLYDAEVMTTPEDCEQILRDAFEDEPLEFLPAGLLSHIVPAARLFGKSSIRFAGVHPNCESATFLVSDGERYHPLSFILKRPLADVAPDLIDRAEKANPRMAALDPDKPFQRLWGQLLVLRAFGGLALGAFDFRKIMKGNRLLGILRLFGGLLLGRHLKEQVRRHTNVPDGVAVTILPFEERHSVESARLAQCTAGFAYVDPDTDQVETVPFCMWTFYRQDTLRRIADRYAQAEGSASGRCASLRPGMAGAAPG